MKVINKKRRFMNYKQRMKNRRWINIMITVLDPGPKVIYGEESI